MLTNNKFIGLDNFFLDGINTKMKAFVKNPIVRMIEHMISIGTLETTSLYARPASCIRIKKTAVADWLYSEIPFTFCKHDNSSKVIVKRATSPVYIFFFESELLLKLLYYRSLKNQ